MLGKSNLLRNASIALFCMAVSAAASSQDYENTVGQKMTATVEDHQRYEAERRRQEQARLEAERRKQEALRFETERLRQDNERREQERLRLENERLRQEIERHEQEQLRIENERLERERAQAAAAAARQEQEEVAMTSGPDVFEQLRTLGQLRDQEILTELEFQRLKKKVLE
jgi:hypothetical protein